MSFGKTRTFILQLAYENGGEISLQKLCAHSINRGGKIQRINHHLLGLTQEGFMVAKRSQRNQYNYKITKKGRNILNILLATANSE